MAEKEEKAQEHKKGNIQGVSEGAKTVKGWLEPALAICQVRPIKFGNMKVIFDVTLVVCSCILGLLFAGGIKGVREGTVAAVCVGLITKLINRICAKLGFAQK